MLIVGAALIAVGANLLVDNGTKNRSRTRRTRIGNCAYLCRARHFSAELVTAITSLVKGHGSLSLGNIVGANLFNLVLVSGVSVTLSPFAIPCEKTIGGMNASLAVDIPLMIAVMAILTVPALIRGKLSRAQGNSPARDLCGFCVFQFAA